MNDSGGAIPLWGVVALQILIFGAAVAVVIGVTYFSRRRTRAAWSALAASAGLSFEPGGFFTLPRVTGVYRGHELTLDTFTRGSGKNRRVFTRLVLFVNNQANIYLALYQENVFSKIGKFFGLKDVQVGDEEIDRRFVIKSRPESLAANLFLSIGLRQQLLQARVLNVEVDGRELTCEQSGVLTDVEYLRFLMDLLTLLAERVEQGIGWTP